MFVQGMHVVQVTGWMAVVTAIWQLLQQNRL
jgi:hypothetical protein